MSFTRSFAFGAALLFAISAAAPTADSRAILQGGRNIHPQNHSSPKLNLSAAERERIREMLVIKQPKKQIKPTKSAKQFWPTIGAVLPKAIKARGLPPALTRQISPLATCGYVKMHEQILIVNARAGRIVEIIPEIQPRPTSSQE
jgi:hypothetical protein